MQVTNYPEIFTNLLMSPHPPRSVRVPVRGQGRREESVLRQERGGRRPGQGDRQVLGVAARRPPDDRRVQRGEGERIRAEDHLRGERQSAVRLDGGEPARTSETECHPPEQ